MNCFCFSTAVFEKQIDHGIFGLIQAATILICNLKKNRFKTYKVYSGHGNKTFVALSC